MVYSSVIFLFYFLPVLLVLYYALRAVWLKNIVLFAAGMVFYAWAEGRLLFLLLAVGLSAWGFAYLIAFSRFKTLWVYVAVTAYILILVYYKYLGFLIDNFLFPFTGYMAHVRWLMPAGVSFFIFQALSYILDVHRDNDTFERKPLYTVLYITMFPQLISGPLVRYSHMAPQLRERIFDMGLFISGVKRFMGGLGKKVLIANPLGLLVTEITGADHALLAPSAAWLGMVAFTLQLYFDFSGYTDMAIGVGRMLGFQLPENFNHPYISRSVSEFWRRWHITLSNWLRDYLFLPMSLNLRRLRRTGVFIAVFITFVICGMWHSPGWNFIIWGAIHGLFLGIELLFLEKYLIRLRYFAVVYLLLVVITGFVFVSLPDTPSAMSYLGAMFTPASGMAMGISAFISNQYAALLVIGAIFSLPVKEMPVFNNKRFESLLNWTESVFLVIVFILSAMAVTGDTYNPFLYFKF